LIICFEIKGPNRDVQAAKDFILNMYLDLSYENDKNVYHHYTCATGKQ
jgi:hypothetical protein